MKHKKESRKHCLNRVKISALIARYSGPYIEEDINYATCSVAPHTVSDKNGLELTNDIYHNFVSELDLSLINAKYI